MTAYKANNRAHIYVSSTARQSKNAFIRMLHEFQ